MKISFALFILATAFMPKNKKVLVSAAEDHTSWDDLASSLSDEDIFQVSTASDWYEQCVTPFFDIPSEYDGVSNHVLLKKPSGLCMGATYCGYKECNRGPGYNPSLVPSFSIPTAVFPDVLDEAFFTADSTLLALPDATVHPQHVGDVSTAIKFAAKHKIEVSVKSTGHSFTGSSTKEGSLLLNLSQLKKYSPSGSITECESDYSPGDEGAVADACKLAIARGKRAVIRVGGGEIWDEPLVAVSKTWNENDDNIRKYHIVTGGAATVSAAGGWLQSGGLSGNNGMRKYGVGVDQVLHIEMVLPNGVHVRFGPAEWEKKEGMMAPQTTHVKGYCNQGDLSDEDTWDWQECGEDEEMMSTIDFNDLWYAVRGGGGGAYGVVTSLYYQLHQQEAMEGVYVISQYMEIHEGNWYELFAEFVLRFLYDPETVGVTEETSRSCSSPDTGGFIQARANIFFCFGQGSGYAFRSAFEKFLEKNDPLFPAYKDNIDEIVVVDVTYPSYADLIIALAVPYTQIPPGSGTDSPLPLLLPSFYTFPDGSKTFEFILFPEKALREKRDIIAPMIVKCVSEGKCAGNAYIMGGAIPYVSDGMNAFPIHRRHGGFMMALFDLDLRKQFQEVFYGVGEDEGYTGDHFPGALCHNHASADFPTPHKDDWTTPCHPAMSDAEREEKCFTYQETAWGTEINAKLEMIHEKVDPDHLFNCWDCAGYAEQKSTKKAKKEAKGSKKASKAAKASKV